MRRNPDELELIVLRTLWSHDRNAALLRFSGELDPRDIEDLRRAISAAE